MTTESRRIESAYLLPVALSKSQFGEWYTAALDEWVVKHGECMTPVELWLDRAQLRREPQPFNAWRPRGELQRVSIPAEEIVEWSLSPGAILGFRNVEGLMLEVRTRVGEEELHFLAFDARLFDEKRDWLSTDTRDRLLKLVSQALLAKPAGFQAAPALPEEQQRLSA